MVTAGAAQESILGSDLWIVAYYGLIKLKLPEGCQIEGYADDFTLTITEQTDVLLQYKLNHVMRKINQWITEHGLDLDAQKIDIVFLTRKRIPLLREMNLGGTIVETRKQVKYLGVTLNSKLTFWNHIKNTADKAAVVTIMLIKRKSKQPV